MSGCFPACGPNLSPIDFCTWESLEDKIYCPPYNMVKGFEAALVQGIEEMPKQRLKDEYMFLIYHH